MSLLRTCACCCGDWPKHSGEEEEEEGSYAKLIAATRRRCSPSEMRCWLLYTKDMKSATAEIACRGGYVTLRLSRYVFVAMLPLSLKPSLLTNSSTKSPSKRSLDHISKRMVRAWLAVKLLTDTTVDRPISLTVTGSVAVAVLVISGEPSTLQISDSDIDDTIYPGLLQGAIALTTAYPTANLSFSFEQYNITNTPSETTGSGITAWPCAVTFNDKLYLFHQGRGVYAKKLYYNVFDGSSWGEYVQVYATTASEGPSAVVFNEKLYLFHQGSPGSRQVWYNVFDGTDWAGETLVYNTRITGGPSAVVYDNKLYCFHQGYTGNDNEFWYNTFDGESWAGDTLVDDTQITASPSAVVFQDLIYCFYQGIGDYENTLLMNVFDPSTATWSGHSKVPLTTCMAEGPSAVVFDGRMYVFYQSAAGRDAGTLYFNSTSDGVTWKGFTPVGDAIVTDGLGTTVFDSELYCFYQGAGDYESTLQYRSFESGSLEWERLFADPALQQLGYSSGYAGFQELAEAMSTSSGTDNGYVVCVTKFPLTYSAYADGTRLCIKYPSDDISTTFAQLFDSNGIYDDTTSSDDSEPRYTFAQTSALTVQLPIAFYSQAFVFHQGADDSGTQLWFSLIDRRTSKWAEMQGPTTSTTYTGIAALLYDSQTYVFYSGDSDGSLYYNVLEGTSWDKEQVVPSTYSSATPSVVMYNDNLYCLHQGKDNNNELWYNVFNMESSTWEGDIHVSDTYIVLGPSAVVFNDILWCFFCAPASGSKNHQLRYTQFDGSSWKGYNLVPYTYMTGEPSAVLYDGKIYVFHQGGYTDGTLWYNVYDGSAWEGDTKVVLDDLKITGGPSAIVMDGKLYVFFRSKSDNTQIWYNVLDGSNGWTGKTILTTGSGTATQPGALAIGFASIDWDQCPAE